MQTPALLHAAATVPVPMFCALPRRGRPPAAAVVAGTGKLLAVMLLGTAGWTNSCSGSWAELLALAQVQHSSSMQTSMSLGPFEDKSR